LGFGFLPLTGTKPKHRGHPKHAYSYQKEKEYRCVDRPKVSEQINKTSFKNFLGLCIHIYTSTNTSKTKLYSIDTKTLHV